MKHITKKRVSRGRKRGQVRTQARPRKRASVTRHRKKNKSRRGLYTKKRKVMAGGVRPDGWDGWEYSQKYDHVVNSKENWMNLDDKTKIQFINEIPGDLLDNTLRMVNYPDNSQNVVDAIIKRLSDPPKKSETSVLNTTTDLTRDPSSALPRPYLEPSETSSSSSSPPQRHASTMMYPPPSTPLPGSIHSSVAYKSPVSPQRPSRPPPPPPTLGSIKQQPSVSIPPPPSQSPPPSHSPPFDTELPPPNLLSNLTPVQNTHDVPINSILLEKLKENEKTNKSGNNNSRTVICDCTRSSTTPTPISTTLTPTLSLFGRAKEWFKQKNK